MKRKESRQVDYEVELDKHISKWCARELHGLDVLHDRLHSPAMDKTMIAITWTGNLGLIWILAAVVMLLLFPQRKESICLLIAMLLSVSIGNVALKNSVRRARPFFHKEYKLLIKRPWDYSFPSGHTLASFASATVFAQMDWRAGIVAYCYASLIALSRLFLRVHFFTDVFFSMILGVGLGILADYLYLSHFFGLF